MTSTNTIRQAPTRRYDLVVFDWDGTLVDSIGAIVGCTLDALGDLGLEPPPPSAIRGVIGLGLREIADRFLPGGDPALVTRLVERYRHHWFGRWGLASPLFEGVPSLLEDLRSRGYLLAVATAKGTRGLLLDLERLGLATAFDATRTAEQSASKPDPLMLEELLTQLGCDRERSLMVGDAVWDIDMAHNARIDAVAVTSGAEERVQLEARRPRAVLDRATELHRWLDR